MTKKIAAALAGKKVASPVRTVKSSDNLQPAEVEKLARSLINRLAKEGIDPAKVQAIVAETLTA